MEDNESKGVDVETICETDIVPNAIECQTSVICDWVHEQLNRLFRGRRESDSRLGRNHGSDSRDYDSPMVLPVSWHPKRAMEQLRGNSYYVTEKYDGVRYFLILVQRSNKQYAFMINRRGSIYSVSVSCNSEYFNGSLFEGELIFNSKTHKQEFYVFDLIALHGHHVHTIENGHLFGDRMQWIREIFGGIPYDQYTTTTWKVVVENGFQTNPGNGRGAPDWRNKIISMGNHYSLQFFPKLFYLLETYDCVFMARKDIPNDGYIFTPNYCPIGPPQSHEQPRIWKWKPNTTIDCWIYPSDPIVYLIYKRQREPLKFVRTQGRDGKPVVYHCRWKLPAEGNFQWDDLHKWHIVECLVECKHGHEGECGEILFVPTRIRRDKTFPNSTKTFQQTLPTIFDPTPIEHVFGNSHSHGDAL